MSTTIIGFPRLGEFRELKFTTEKYFRKEISEEELLAAAKDLRAKHWNIVKEKGITEIPSNDFSHYDNFLDAAFLFNVVPASVQNLDLSDLERYFALGRGYQGEKGDVRALPMKKWFNTNYHYIVPKFEKDTQVKLAGHKIFDEFQEAKELGLNTRPVLVGPFTFLQLSDFEEGVKADDFVDSLVAAYQEVFAKLAELGATRIQLDEAALVKDLTAEEKALFLNLYNKLLADKKGLEVLLQTYFGDVRDVYADLVNLPVDAIGLDFVEGKKTLELVKGGFPADKTLYVGQELAPHFISVTASNNKFNIKETTVRLADFIQNDLAIPTIAHLPAIYLTKDKVAETIADLDKVGVQKILALRGDIIPDVEPQKDFRYATDLIEFIKEQAPHFDIIGACYPEGHPDSPNQISDIQNLKKKVDAGCSSLVTQLFFDNERFYDFQDKCILAGIDVPIHAGIMPILNRNQALRLLKTCENIHLPRKFKAILDKYEHDPESLRAAGLAYAVDQIVDLVTQDVAGVHLYTMNNADTAKYIHQATHALFNHQSLG